MTVKDIEQKIDQRHLGELMAGGNPAELLSLARDIQRKGLWPLIEFCAIVNAKSGGCPHNCSFCAQSSHHQSPIRAYPLRTAKELLEAAQAAQEAGAHRFSLVTSGARLSDKEALVLCEVIRQIRQETDLLPCASLGHITLELALQLKEAGLVRYHHNLETSPDFYPIICTTQKYEDRLATIAMARRAGLEICVGGILGLGESVQDRINLALEIKHLEPDCVPLNFLDPRPGTPLEGQPVLTPEEALTAIALFRVIMPRAILRLAGGRATILGDHQATALKTGINGLMIGDYLTTKGAGLEVDKHLIASLKLIPSVIEKGIRGCN